MSTDDAPDATTDAPRLLCTECAWNEDAAEIEAVLISFLHRWQVGGYDHVRDVAKSVGRAEGFVLPGPVRRENPSGAEGDDR